MTEQRDYSEETYNHHYCDACGVSPCEWDGTADGFHASTDTEARMLRAHRTACHPSRGCH